MKDKDKILHYLFWGIIAIILILSFFIVKNFLVALASSFILAYLLKPIYDKMEKPLGKKTAAMITVLTPLIILILISGIIITTLVSQIPQLVNQNLANTLMKNLENIPLANLINDYIPELIDASRTLLLKLASSTLSEIPARTIEIFVTFFTTFYLLINWNDLKTKIKDFLPYKNKSSILTQVENVIDDIIKGTFLLAIIETTIAAIAFLILGVPFALLLAFLIGIFTFVPALGPLLVWVPVAIIQLSLGNYTTAIGVIAVGLFLSAYVDNFVRVKLVGKKSNIHPVIMLVGIFGGVTLFGPLGFIIGPLILSILVTLIENVPKIENLS